MQVLELHKEHINAARARSPRLGCPAPRRPGPGALGARRSLGLGAQWARAVGGAEAPGVPGAPRGSEGAPGVESPGDPGDSLGAPRGPQAGPVVEARERVLRPYRGSWVPLRASRSHPGAPRAPRKLPKGSLEAPRGSPGTSKIP